MASPTFQLALMATEQRIDDDRSLKSSAGIGLGRICLAGLAAGGRCTGWGRGLNESWRGQWSLQLCSLNSTAGGDCRNGGGGWKVEEG